MSGFGAGACPNVTGTQLRSSIDMTVNTDDFTFVLLGNLSSIVSRQRKKTAAVIFAPVDDMAQKTTRIPHSIARGAQNANVPEPSVVRLPRLPAVVPLSDPGSPFSTPLMVPLTAS